MSSAERKALDTNRIHKALDLTLTASIDHDPIYGPGIGRSSLVDKTDRLKIEEDSLISSDRKYIETALEDYNRDLAELERSIVEYRIYIRKLRDRNLLGE